MGKLGSFYEIVRQGAKITLSVAAIPHKCKDLPYLSQTDKLTITAVTIT